jgi:phage terminase small subunit
LIGHDLHEGDLPERERKRLINPQSVVKRWQRETQTQINGKCPQDLKRDAKAAWRRFVWCLRSLPVHEAQPLWQAALAEVAAMASA